MVKKIHSAKLIPKMLHTSTIVASCIVWPAVPGFTYQAAAARSYSLSFLCMCMCCACICCGLQQCYLPVAALAGQPLSASRPVGWGPRP
jgi:hypothetical protein